MFSTSVSLRLDPPLTQCLFLLCPQRVEDTEGEIQGFWPQCFDLWEEVDKAGSLSVSFPSKSLPPSGYLVLFIFFPALLNPCYC